MEFVDYGNESIGIYKTPLEQYPIGSLFITTTNTNPGTFIGGTWEAFGTGRTIVGVDTNQTEFSTVNKTGGEKTHTLSSSEMPSHTHTIPEHGHSANVSINANGSHSHTITVNSGGSHNHSASSNWTGTHRHNFLWGTNGPTNGDNIMIGWPGANSSNSWTNGGNIIADAGGHSHTITVNSGGSHNHSASSNSTGSHTHAATVSVGNKASFSANSTGGSAAHNNLQPYITVYMWKRTK